MSSYDYVYQLKPAAAPSGTGAAQQQDVSSPPSHPGAADVVWRLHLVREALRAARSLAAAGHPEAQRFLGSIGVGS